MSVGLVFSCFFNSQSSTSWHVQLKLLFAILQILVHSVNLPLVEGNNSEVFSLTDTDAIFIYSRFNEFPLEKHQVVTSLKMGVSVNKLNLFCFGILCFQGSSQTTPSATFCQFLFAIFSFSEVERCFPEQLLQRISQNLQENTCDGALFSVNLQILA